MQSSLELAGQLRQVNDFFANNSSSSDPSWLKISHDPDFSFSNDDGMRKNSNGSKRPDESYNRREDGPFIKESDTDMIGPSAMLPGNYSTNQYLKLKNYEAMLTAKEEQLLEMHEKLDETLLRLEKKQIEQETYEKRFLEWKAMEESKIEEEWEAVAQKEREMDEKTIMKGGLDSVEGKKTKKTQTTLKETDIQSLENYLKTIRSMLQISSSQEKLTMSMGMEMGMGDLKGKEEKKEDQRKEESQREDSFGVPLKNDQPKFGGSDIEVKGLESNRSFGNSSGHEDIIKMLDFDQAKNNTSTRKSKTLEFSFDNELNFKDEPLEEPKQSPVFTQLPKERKFLVSFEQLQDEVAHNMNNGIFVNPEGRQQLAWYGGCLRELEEKEKELNEREDKIALKEKTMSEKFVQYEKYFEEVIEQVKKERKTQRKPKKSKSPSEKKPKKDSSPSENKLESWKKAALNNLEEPKSGESSPSSINEAKRPSLNQFRKRESTFSRSFLVSLKSEKNQETQTSISFSVLSNETQSFMAEAEELNKSRPEQTSKSQSPSALPSNPSSTTTQSPPPAYNREMDSKFTQTVFLNGFRTVQSQTPGILIKKLFEAQQAEEAQNLKAGALSAPGAQNIAEKILQSESLNERVNELQTKINQQAEEMAETNHLLEKEMEKNMKLVEENLSLKDIFQEKENKIKELNETMRSRETRLKSKFIELKAFEKELVYKASQLNQLLVANQTSK